MLGVPSSPEIQFPPSYPWCQRINQPTDGAAWGLVMSRGSASTFLHFCSNPSYCSSPPARKVPDFDGGSPGSATDKKNGHRWPPSPPCSVRLSFPMGHADGGRGGGGAPSGCKSEKTKPVWPSRGDSTDWTVNQTLPASWPPSSLSGVQDKETLSFTGLNCPLLL